MHHPLPLGTEIPRRSAEGLMRRWLPVLGVALLLTLAAFPGTAADRQLGADAFGRTQSGGWGTADQGGPWTNVGNAAALSVSGGWGVMTLPSGGASRGAFQGQLNARDVEITARVRMDKLPAGGSVY